MKIERAVLREIPLTLAEPFQSSAGVVTRRNVVLLTLQTDDGLEGWAECVAPGEPTYTYETTATAWHVLTDIVLPRAVGLDVSEPWQALRAASGVRGHEMAKATLEMAAWDVAARAAGVSLAEMLGASRGVVPVGVAVGMMGTPDALGDRIERYLADGYGRVKVKIAPGRDVEVLTTLRARFPDLALWADANSAYTLDDMPRLKELDALALEMIEEPLAPGRLSECARLQAQLETPVCLDESIVTEGDVETALQLGSCRVVNLKPGRVGGLGAGRAMHDTLVAAGVPVWCGGMLETGVGRAHNLALAALPGFTLPGDISGSRRYWDRDIVWPEFEVMDGTMAVPDGPGIGVEIDRERVEALTLRVAEFT